MMTIEEYLKGLFVNYPIPDATIASALAHWDIPAGSPAFQRDAEGNEDPIWVRKRELAAADIYLAMFTMVNKYGDSKQIGNRRFTEGGTSTSADDRALWWRWARYYYGKWNVPMPVDDDEPMIMDASGLWGGTGCCYGRR